MKEKDSPQHFSTVDGILLCLLVGSIFFEPYLPYFAKRSTPFWIFVIATAYTMITRLRALEKILSSYYFIAVMAFALICAFMESFHPNSDYSIVLRFLSMASGMFCISILCRNSKTVDVILYTFIVCSALQAIILIQGTFGFLSAYSASGFDEASRARIHAFENLSIKDYVDDVSILSSIGAVLGMVAFFYETRRWKKIILFVLFMLSLIGTLLPASRTGALVVLVSVIIFWVKSKISWKKLVVPVVIISVLMIFIIPQVVWERIGSVIKISEMREGDSRAKLYSAMIGHFNQYAIKGVGMGYYWKSWAVSAGLTNIASYNEPTPTHNAFFQIWIYWGLPGIVSFLTMLYVFSKAMEKNFMHNRQKTSIYIFMIIIPLVLLFYPLIYHKAFAVGVGLMLAAKFWNIFDEVIPEEEDDEKLIFENNNAG